MLCVLRATRVFMWLKQNVDGSQMAGGALRSPPDTLHLNCGFLSTTLTKAKPRWIKDIAFGDTFTDGLSFQAVTKDIHLIDINSSTKTICPIIASEREIDLPSQDLQHVGHPSKISRITLCLFHVSEISVVWSCQDCSGGPHDSFFLFVFWLEVTSWKVLFCIVIKILCYSSHNPVTMHIWEM